MNEQGVIFLTMVPIELPSVEKEKKLSLLLVVRFEITKERTHHLLVHLLALQHQSKLY